MILGLECSQNDQCNDHFEIFVPAYCHDKAAWLLGPFEDALWDYYKKADARYADAWNSNLFIGLRSDYELNEEEVDGENAFLSYTLHVWDASTAQGKDSVNADIANCFTAADPWARQFFDSTYLTAATITPLVAAEFAVRSQCFSNSRANQRWQTDDAGYWSMNTIHGVAGNVVVNPGWLAPNLEYNVYIQKFDEAVFKGPRAVKRTNDVGQLMIELPTLVEGDRVLLKVRKSDYDLILPCVPEFTGFAGAAGIPYVPNTLLPVTPWPPTSGVVPVSPLPWSPR